MIASVQQSQLDTDAYDDAGEFLPLSQSLHEGSTAEPDVANLWNDTGHHGELWLDDDDGDWVGADHRTRKPVPADKSVVCECGWPLPIRWCWSACEFGEPTCWSDDEGWQFCRCNGCVGRLRQPGRPPERCTECQRVDDNAKRRERYKIVKRITLESVDKHPVFVA
ncbi:hypothetical protein BOH72_14085 [Mycobacterium sp. WY10]|nr:hypothetical protein BOH72_14085 [Mycobacterium sp. WY10]